MKTGQLLSNEHILNCPILNEAGSKNIEIQLIYNGNIEEKLSTLNAFRRQITERIIYLPLDS